MARKALLRVVSIGCALLMASPSWAATPAATATPDVGALMVNKGKGFTEVKQSVRLKVGDKVMVAPGGKAFIAYGDGCKADVNGGSVVTIARLSPCASGANAQDGNNYCTNNNQAQGPECIGPLGWGFIAADLAVAGIALWAISP